MFARLKDRCAVKQYGRRYFLYQPVRDELYELDEEALNEVMKLDGSRSVDRFPADFIAYLADEQLVELAEEAAPVPIRKGAFPYEDHPPLKYLHLIVTTSCNLRCRHCYVENTGEELPVDLARRAVEEFEAAGGLRLLVSGGEPLLYRYFDELNGVLEARSFRSVLLSNGKLLASMPESKLAQLNFDEIQLSLDGTREVHDAIRGTGSFDAVLEAARKIVRSGRQLSFATTVNALNYRIMKEIQRIVLEFSPFRWTVDIICPDERAIENNLIPPAEACRALDYGFKSFIHEAEPGYGCGANLSSLLPDGTLAKCDFFPEWSGGSISDGLVKAWLQIRQPLLAGLDCRCSRLDECRGGCRYRALVYNKSINAPDPIRCRYYELP